MSNLVHFLIKLPLIVLDIKLEEDNSSVEELTERSENIKVSEVHPHFKKSRKSLAISQFV